jgi:hypothetical protein
MLTSYYGEMKNEYDIIVHYFFHSIAKGVRG